MLRKPKQPTNLCCNSYWSGLILIFPQINGMLNLLYRKSLVERHKTWAAFCSLRRYSIRYLIPESNKNLSSVSLHCEVAKRLEDCGDCAFQGHRDIALLEHPGSPEQAEMVNRCSTSLLGPSGTPCLKTLALGGTRARPGPLPGSVGLEPDLTSQLQPLWINLFLSTSPEQHPYLLPAWTYAQPDPKHGLWDLPLPCPQAGAWGPSQVSTQCELKEKIFNSK